jgi:hypothetical protein
MISVKTSAPASSNAPWRGALVSPPLLAFSPFDDKIEPVLAQLAQLFNDYSSARPARQSLWEEYFHDWGIPKEFGQTQGLSGATPSCGLSRIFHKAKTRLREMSIMPVSVTIRSSGWSVRFNGKSGISCSVGKPDGKRRPMGAQTFKVCDHKTRPIAQPPHRCAKTPAAARWNFGVIGHQCWGFWRQMPPVSL